jgi:DNA-binding MurR/RpiR family transcriptional regulator
MDQGPLTERILAAFDGMPGQLQSAARYVLDRPSEVALLSMREQARQAGVPPATMTRLAKRLGLDGYDAVRGLYADAVRKTTAGFARKADLQVAKQKARGDEALAADILATVGRQAAMLAAPARLRQVVAAAHRLADAERIFCLGLRACYPVAWHLHYVMSMLGERAILLDAPGSVGNDIIRDAGRNDCLLAVSIDPYTRATVESAAYAAGRKVPIVAMTDSRLSPLAAFADDLVLIPTDSPSFFHALTPAFLVAEIMAALIAGRGGQASLKALQRTEAQLSAFNVHWAGGGTGDAA